jgi:ABC-type Fe3+/spermidine/putrescine transport system ATPase subunit
MRSTQHPTIAAALAHVRSHGEGGVLTDVSLGVAPGEIVTLLGAGGPQAVLAVLAGFARPQSGTVSIGGMVLNRTPPHRRRLGLVPRRLALFPHLDVTAHARFAPGVTPARAAQLLQRLGLTAFATRLPRSLSPELQLRVALARALGPAPTLLLLEDPLAQVPPPQRPALKALLRELCREADLAILHSTDDASSALALSDRIGVMQSGRLLQLGTARELYDQPLSLPVAAALGPVNRLAGTKLDQEDDIARIRIGGHVTVSARCMDTIADGAGCVVTIRPDRIAVAPGAAADLGEDAIAARLTEALFEGEHTRLRFTLGLEGEAPELLVHRPSGLAVPRAGAMSLAWQPHHAWAFLPEAA